MNIQQFHFKHPASGMWLSPRLEAAEEMRLKSWELVGIPSLPKKLNPILKLTTTNGAVGFSKPLAKDLTAAVEAVKGANLLEHDKLYDLKLSKQEPSQKEPK